MKKFSIFLLGMLGILASSCTDDLEPAKPQQNPQEPILQNGTIQTSLYGTLASSQPVLNLEDYNFDKAMIAVAKLDETKDLPAGATVGYVIELSDTPTFEKKVELQTYPGDSANNTDIYYVYASDWNDAHLQLFGKSYDVKTAYYRIKVYVTLDESDFRFGGIDYYAAEGTISETRMNADYVIEDQYYLLSSAVSFNPSALASATEYRFSHSDENVYDDPVFTLNFEVTQDMLNANGGAFYWQIAPQSSVDNNTLTGVYGTEKDGDTAAEGKLMTTGDYKGKITKASKFKITINMEQRTYKIETLLLYTPGGSNGWNQLASAWLQLSAPKNGKYFYYGVSPIKDGFKICAEPKWNDPTNYGAETDTPANSGKLIVGAGAQNIVPEANGFYWITVNYDQKTGVPSDYILTPVTTVGLIGSFEASGWGSDVAMTADDKGATWTADVEFAAGDEFKVRFNGNWDMNLGGDIKGLTLDGANIKVEKEGTYTVTLKTLGGVPTITMTQK